MSKERYIHDKKIHNTKSAEIVVPFIIEQLKPNSVLDVGCGLGSWLKVFENYGVTDYIGTDGTYLNLEMVECDKSKIKLLDLEKYQNFSRKFDLVITLEVAEHLNESSADEFVKTLINASDNIVFSAAIPFQGGMNHINEQWMDYWSYKFEKEGYKVYDIFRMKFWNEDKVDFWYRQNMYFNSILTIFIIHFHIKQFILNYYISNKINLMGI
jgi:SAM-dependent methyltransferase